MLSCSYVSLSPCQEKLGALVDSLCVDAVDKIVKMVEEAVRKQPVIAGDLKDPPEFDLSSECLMTATEGELRIQKASIIT